MKSYMKKGNQYQICNNRTVDLVWGYEMILFVTLLFLRDAMKFDSFNNKCSTTNLALHLFLGTTELRLVRV